MSQLHPGGEDILLPYLGKNASAAFRDPEVHIHGNSALHLYKKFVIGYISGHKNRDEIKLQSQFKKEAKDFGVDTTKGLVSQASALNTKDYEDFIHNVLVLDGPSLKLFDNPLMEIFTRSPWYVVPLVWIPIVSVLFYKAVLNGLPLWTLPLFIIIGPVLWNFFEYELHKNIFHMQPKNYYTRILHFLLHGYHHIAPMDHLRLTFPPVPAAIIGFLIYVFCGLIFLPLSLGLSIMGAIISGYIYYDLTHYYLHHAPPQFFLAKELKIHHLYHHYKDEQYNFGISMWLFDKLNNTYDPVMMMERRRRMAKEKIQ